jgi:hypothetical protein
MFSFDDFPLEAEVIKSCLGKGWLRSWVQLPPGPLLSFWLTTALNYDCFRLLSEECSDAVSLMLIKKIKRRKRATAFQQYRSVCCYFLFYPSPSSSTITISSASPLPRVPLAASITIGPNVAPPSLLTLATGMSLV